ncbi:tryptophan synthase subunit alpha [Marinococcus halotolerans]|uniref:tryptophan synthase subunit alpha n=1 Tax=Marinococcus halotolerans TaxID=301092 RepID=UPI0003B454DC|nr:tryptophan synthase subunit alpha [Marinococcus halotolerans]
MNKATNVLTVEEAAAQASYPLFVPFIMAGDPDEEATISIALSLQEAGAHILELGIPYSDPLADGPLLQRSAQRALKGGMSLKGALRTIRTMRERGLTIPVVVFSYVNPVLRMGEETFVKEAASAGANGVLIPDLPMEESSFISELAKEKELSVISLVAPTSAHRIEKIASQAQGFLYCVSSLGVTGTRDAFPDEAYAFIRKVKEASTVPVAVGFGISNRRQVELLDGVSDGIVVGSAIMKIVEQQQEALVSAEKTEREQALNEIKTFVSELISS